MKPRIDVIAGFLGAGKTTLILELLKDIPEGVRLAVCENEFGQEELDGDTLRGQGVEVTDVNAGCVCCTLSPNLVAGLKLLAARFKPTRIILEPTGLANLPDILNILRDQELEGVVEMGAAAAVIDGGAMLANYDRYKTYFDAQLACADVFFVNRTDGLDDAGKLRLADIIDAVNPGARVEAAPFAPAAAWEALDAPGRGDNAPYAGLPKGWLKQFEAIAAGTEKPGSRERLEALLDGSVCGDIVRVKGYVTDAAGGRYRVDVSGGSAAFPAGEGGRDVVQIIGRRLRRQRVLDWFT